MIRLSLLFLFFSQVGLIAQATEEQSNRLSVNEKIHDISDIPPILEGCEDKLCTEKELYTFIYSMIKYPSWALRRQMSGIVVLQFVVTKSGQIANIEIVQDPGFDMGKAAKDALSSMNELNIKWIPGKKNGEKVNVKYTLPVKFQLATIKKNNTIGF